MNKIKQTEQNLKQIKNILHPQNNSNLSFQSTEELLKQSHQILQQKLQQVKIQNDPKYIDSKKIVEIELKERQKKFQQRKKDLEELLCSSNDSDEVNFYLLNSMMQKLTINYHQINPVKVQISANNKLNSMRIQSRKTSSKYPSSFNCQIQKETQSLIKDNQSLDLNDIITEINTQHNITYDQIIREDKAVYEVQIIENQTYEEEKIEIIFDQIIEKQDLKYKFTFLNKIEHIDLSNIDMSPSQYFSQVNMYRIFREIIIEALDHVSISQINIFSQSFEEYQLPSKLFRQQMQYNESLESPLSSQEKRIKQIEKQVQSLAQKISSQKNDKLHNLQQLYSISVDQLKDFRIQMIPHNQGYQALRAIKDHLKETSNINIQAGTKQGRGGIDKLQKGEFFLKQKGQKNEFHKCWLEQRGFHLLWYHSKSDKIARGIGQLDDIQIKDVGPIYQVNLLDRSLFIKLEKPFVGQIWRKAISNQIAYKVYLNNLWLNCRLFDKSPKIDMIEYYFNENLNTFNISNNALQINNLENALPLCYIIYYTSTIFDSLINHKIIELNLSNSKLGSTSIIQLFQFFQSNKNRLTLIDLSNCNLNIEVMREFAKFLLHKNSFALNHILLNNNQGIGNEGIEILSKAISDRYILYWEKNEYETESVSPGYRRHKMVRTDRIDLELLTDFNLKNIGATNFNDLFDSIGLMFSKVMDMQPPGEEEIVMNKSQTLSRIMKKLKNKPGQFNRHNLRILKNFYDNEFDSLVDIIKISLDISENFIQNLDKLGELITNQDCLRKIHITNLELEEFLSFTNYLNNSVALETLNINCNKIIDIPQMLESLIQNRSIRSLIITQSYIDLESRLQVNDVNNQQFYVANIQQL